MIVNRVRDTFCLSDLLVTHVPAVCLCVWGGWGGIEIRVQGLQHCFMHEYWVVVSYFSNGLGFCFVHVLLSGPEWSDLGCFVPSFSHRALSNSNTDTCTQTLPLHLVCRTMTSFQEKEEKITWQTHLCNQLFMWPQARGWMSTASGYRLYKTVQQHICKYTWMQRDLSLFCSYLQVYFPAIPLCWWI